MSLVLHSIVTDLKKSFVATKLRHCNLLVIITFVKIVHGPLGNFYSETSI